MIETEIKEIARQLFDVRATQAELQATKEKLEAELRQLAPVTMYVLDSVKAQITAINKEEAAVKAAFVKLAIIENQLNERGKGRFITVPFTLFKEHKDVVMPMTEANISALYRFCEDTGVVDQVFTLSLDVFKEGPKPAFLRVVEYVKPYVDGHDKWVKNF